jgi:AmmeMemoRadiSam system protein A
MLPAELRARLLQLARRAIEDCLRGEAYRAAPDLAPELLRNSGAFVTVRRRGDHELRGCIGFVEPIYPLHESVARAAAAAATEDRRFEPVTRAELPELELDISILGPPFPIQPGEVEVGRHGLIVERGPRRGLLLPQVPIEWGWDAPTFVEHTCRKAGLPMDAWRDPDTKLWAFEAEIFSEA